jgi:hypothetical protein
MAALGLGVVALAAILAPAFVLAGRTGLTVRTARTWGVADATPPAQIGIEPLALDQIPTGAAPFLVASGWLYAPSAGSYGFTVRPPGPATLWLDGSSVVVVPPAPEVEPIIGVDRGHYRESMVYLGRGFHRLDVWYPAGGTPRPRWRLPYAEHALRLLPVDHLLVTDAAAGDRLIRARALEARRWGVLGLAGLAIAGLAWAGARLAPSIAGPRRAGLTAAGHAALALVFFTLTETSLLLWPGQLDTLRPVLLVGVSIGMLASAILALLRDSVRRSTGARFEAWSGRTRAGLSVLALLSVQIALGVRFLLFVDGRLPLPGDHSAFLYRYHTLLHTLPRLRGYDPWWNAGTVDPSPAMSGAPVILALFWPLLWFGPLERVYATFVPLVGVVLVPWCLFAATRLLGASWLAALLAGVLALAPDEAYFWWFMAHGTLPAAVSAGLATLTIALAWRVFVRHDRRRGLVSALTAALTIGLAWGFFAAMVGPALLFGALLCRRRLGRRELAVALGVAGVLLLVHAPGLVGIRGMPQAAYAQPGAIEAVPWREFLALALETALVDPNAIALVLGGAGVFLLPRPLRAAYGAFVGSLLLTATLARPLFRGLELERFFIPLSFALIPPAAWLVARLLQAAARPGAPATAAGLGIALLALVGVHAEGVWRQYAGEVRRGASQMEFQSEETKRLVEWLRTATPANARILVWGDLPGPGRLAGGYKAFLQPLTGRPLIGRHQNLKFVDLDVQGLLMSADLQEALQLFNVRHVVVRDEERSVRARLDEAPGLTLRERLPGEFLVYDTAITPGYLIGARGTVAFDYDRLRVRLDEPVTTPVTLKFRWAPGLVSHPPLALEPVEVRPGIRFIRVHPAGVQEFRIEYVACCWWHPAQWWARWRSRS